MSELVKIEVWVPAALEEEVRDAIDEIIIPPKVSDETLRVIQANAKKAKAAQDEADWRYRAYTDPISGATYNVPSDKLMRLLLSRDDA